MKSATEMVKNVRVSSVLGSVIFLIPWSMAALVVSGIAHNEFLEIFFGFVVGILLLVFIPSFVGILLFGDKNDLKSEDYSLKMRALELLGDQNADYKDSLDIIPENNPELPSPTKTKVPKITSKVKHNHE
jgi:hypothetical protein